MPSIFSRGALLSLAAAITFSACGSGESSQSTAEQSTRTVQHRFGVTKAPFSPKRIVAVGATDADTLVTLGLPPIGAVDAGGFTKSPFYPWVNSELVQAKTKPLQLNDAGAAKVEQVAALKPDLIIMVNVYVDPEKQYRDLSALAPTIAAKSGNVIDESWQAQARHIAQAVGKKSAIEKSIADVEGSIREAAAANPQFKGKTLSYGGVFDTTEISVVFGEKDYSRVFLAQLGFSVPAKQLKELPALAIDDVGTQAAVGLERLDLLDADVLLIGYLTPGAQAEFSKRPVFQKLAVVAQKRYLATDGPTIAALRIPSVLAVPYVLGQLVPKLQTTVR